MTPLPALRADDGLGEHGAGNFGDGMNWEYSELPQNAGVYAVKIHGDYAHHDGKPYITMGRYNGDKDRAEFDTDEKSMVPFVRDPNDSVGWGFVECWAVVD